MAQQDCRLSEKQLLTRDVAFPQSAAPLPDGTTFISPAGVMRLKGTAVSRLQGCPRNDFGTSDSLLYLYKENALLLYRPGEEGILCYDLAKGSWKNVDGTIHAHHYAWPHAWIRTGDRLLRASLLRKERPAKLSSASRDIPVAVTTRPLKLGSAFTVKKLEEVEALWPDGSRLPLKVYGAMTLSRWHFLGLARKGHMIMRGSGWRFFKIETFATISENGYCLPQIFIKFAH